MPQYQASSDSLEGAKNSAKDSGEQTKRAANQGKEETKQWGRSVKDSAADSWEQTKQWGQEKGNSVEGSLDSTFRHTEGDHLVDFGYPLVNKVFDGLVKVGGVGALHAVSLDTFKYLTTDESKNKKSLEASVKRVGQDALQWGLVAGVYSGVSYGIQEARGVHDWKNALLGGALTGAALSLSEANPGTEAVLRGAITGGAIATAAEILKNIT